MEVLRRIYEKDYKEIPFNDFDAVDYLITQEVSMEEIKKRIEKNIGMDYLEKDNIEFDKELVRFYDIDEMKEKRLMPIYIKDGEIHFVANEFKDRVLRDYANNFKDRYDENLKVNLSKFIMSYEFENLLESLYKNEDEDDIDEYLEEDQNRNVFDVERIADRMFEKGFDFRASDIHIEPLKNGFQVRYRIDGQFSQIDNYDVEDKQTVEMINHIKIRSGLNIADKRTGQDGNIENLAHRGKRYDLRISSISTTRGEKIVIRILAKENEVPPFEALGFSNFYIKTIKKDLNKKHGLILNTGSVGSGKSTTQTTILNSFNALERNIYSIEDPVERTIDYVNHVDVKRTGESFEKHLETLLRQDPDVIAIGEIRNLATMNMAIKASLTGQIVFATLHTNSATEAFQRIFKMGVEAFELGAAIEGVGSQRLVRTLCEHCKVKRKITDHERSIISTIIKQNSNIEVFHLSKFDYVHDHSENGCKKCNGTGFKGRTVVAEYLSANDEIKEYISGGVVLREKIIELAEDSFLPIELDAVNKILLGVTTVSEVLKVV